MVSLSFDPSLVLKRDMSGRLMGRIVCASCNQHASLSVKSSSHAMVPEFMSKKIRGIGWFPGKTRSDDLCPSCRPNSPQSALPEKPFAIGAPDFDALLDNAFNPEPSKEIKMLDKVTPTVIDSAKKLAMRICLSRSEERPIIKMLEDNLEVIDGKCRYLNGMTDTKITEILAETNARINYYHVRNIRIDVFGALIKPPKIEAMPPMKWSRFEILEKRVSDLETFVLELSSRK
jgi:hypothetical protein